MMKTLMKENCTMRFFTSVVIVFVLTMLSSCLPMPPQKSAAQHSESLGSAHERNLTLGVVQSRIKKGMPQSDVAAVLGSPNLVTTDANGNETWIYDKVATETSHSESSRSKSASVGGGALGGIIGSVAGILGGIAGNQSVEGSNQAGATSQTQRTLTVVIKFNAKHLVKDVRWQMSSF